MIDKAYDIFKYENNINLGPAMHTSNAGIHAGSLAAIYQMIVGGLDWHNNRLHIESILLKRWDKLTYRFKYQNGYFEVVVKKDKFTKNFYQQKSIKVQFYQVYWIY
ncbi:hypothetical protein Me_995_000037 [Mycoplasmopsis edwardii]|uniref:Uncharacterized protein n=1 Tax=Mycoplasmopsis edwardii TaxID=53558 RepID=A0ACD4PHE7_9BACT|nr:glycosyl hydrolase family 65 protein [Mycoplasmopsis edwardii]WBP84091.1 hypothetical protein Me_995_000037 [Mycoplasmopsis edwardii]